MGNKSREHDQSMAQRMKAAGEERTTGVCCLCFKTYPLTAMVHHLTRTCQGPNKRKGSNGHVPHLFSLPR